MDGTISCAVRRGHRVTDPSSQVKGGDPLTLEQRSIPSNRVHVHLFPVYVYFPCPCPPSVRGHVWVWRTRLKRQRKERGVPVLLGPVGTVWLTLHGVGGVGLGGVDGGRGGGGGGGHR